MNRLYRDFVIRTFNEDRPYDEFVQMQLAGDLTPEPTADDYVAVGYLRLGAWNNEPDDALVDRFDQLDDIVSTTGLVFLGMTIGCARCHDHPEEPITSVDYARLVGCFHGLARPTQGQLETAWASATPQQLAHAAQARQRQQMLRRQAFWADAAESALLRQKAARIDEDVRFEQAYRFVETDVSREPTRRLLRGDPHHPGEFVHAGVPSVLADGQFRKSVLPRRQLAEWLTSSGRSLTARLIVNRIWAWHFGRGLVETPSNFGLNGADPTHPELLEWLAGWFVHEANWSLKELHRLILTSQTYRTRIDLRNQRRQQLYGSFPRNRLRAEVLQDAMLTIAGLRDAAMYGPPVSRPSEDPYSSEFEGGPTSSESLSQRRGIYSLVKRNAPAPFFATFDSSNSAVSCAERRTTHTSQQALTLWNGPLAQKCATAVAEQVIKEHPLASSQQVDAAFFRIIGRVPDAFEQQTAIQFLDRPTHASGSRIAALSQLCLVLFNSDEFVFLD